jgi:hypothetical protein
LHLGYSSGINKVDVTRVFEELGENCKKIAVTTEDGVSQCPVEIEKWDFASRQAWLWAKVPKISNTIDTVLYLYYDKNQPDNISMVGEPGSDPAKKVWDNHYRMVLHLDQAGSGKAGEYLDSTGNGNSGTGGNGNKSAAPEKVGAVIGDGQSFDGGDDYIQVADNDDLSINTTGQFTVSAWISPAVLDFSENKQYIRWMGKGGPGRLEWQFVMYNMDGKGTDGGSRSQWISFYVYSPNRGDGAGGGGAHNYIAPGDWIFVTGTTDMMRSYGFFDGRRAPVTDDWSSYDIHYINGSDPLRIGTHYLADGDWWHGRMDEVRISNVTRSSAWMRADYFSQSDRLVNYKAAVTQTTGNQTPGNQAPALSPIDDQTITAGELLTFKISAIDADGDTLEYTALNLPRGAMIDPLEHIFIWNPEADQVGVYRGIRVIVSDGVKESYEEITITVKPVKDSADTIINSSPSQAGLAGSDSAVETLSQSIVIHAGNNSRTFRIVGLAAILLGITVSLLALVRHYKKGKQ